MKRRNFLIKGGMMASLVMSSTSFSQREKSAQSSDKLNIGVIGTGSRGGGLISVINKIDNLNVTACCDILPFRLEEGLGRTEGMAKGYTDYRHLLDDKEIDAVLVATPFSTHAEIEIDALDAGKHVYGEKTMAKGYTQIQALLEAKAKASKCIFQTGHQLRSSRLHRHVVEMIKEGKIGQIAAVECQYNRNGNWRRPVPDPKLERLINWRMYREFSGGLTAELSSHHIDLVNWVLDSRPIQVMGTGGIDYWKDGRETYDNTHLIYSYPDGVEAKYTCLTTNALNGAQIKIMGSKGTFIMDHFNGWFYPKGNQEKKHGEVDGVSGATIQWEAGKGIPVEMEHFDPSRQAFMDFRDNIINNRVPTSNMVSGAKTAAAVQMALDAMYGNKIVKWDFDIPSP